MSSIHQHPAGRPLRALKSIGKASNMLRDAFNQIYLLVGEVTPDGQLPVNQENDEFLLHAKCELSAMLKASQDLEAELAQRVQRFAYEADSRQLNESKSQAMPVFVTPQLPEFL